MSLTIDYSRFTNDYPSVVRVRRDDTRKWPFSVLITPLFANPASGRPSVPREMSAEMTDSGKLLASISRYRERKTKGKWYFRGRIFIMARKTRILIFWLAILLGLALIAYRRFHPPSSAAARQHEQAARQHEEEAVKRAQLEADLRKAAEAGRRSHKTSQRYTRRPTRTRRT